MRSERRCRMAWFLITVLLSPLLTACALNSTKRLPHGAGVRDGRAIVVYGVAVEGNWSYPAFGVQLDEYRLSTQSVAGNCFQFNRTEATVPSAPHATRYFAFDVSPGHYVYSAFHTAPLAQGTQAFAAPAGRIVYVGDFVYTRDRVVVVRRDFEAPKRSISVALPDLKGDIAFAEAVSVLQPKPFLCSP